MNVSRSSVSAVAVLLGAVPFAAAADQPVPKQLSGTPAEFASMRAPDPAAAAIHSKSALMPVRFAADARGKSGAQLVVPIERGSTRFVLFGAAQTAQVDLSDSQGRRQPARALAKHARPSGLALGDALHAGELYVLDDLHSGHWTLSLRAEPGQTGDGFVLIEGDPATELASYQTHRRQLVGESIGVAAMLSTTDDTIELGTAAGRIVSADLRVTLPDGTVRTYAMHDDGLHGDGDAGDGVFGGSFPATQSGRHLAQVVVHGFNREGQPLLRTAEHVIPVIERSLSLGSNKAAGTARAAGRIGIEVPVTTAKSADGRHYRAYGEVWGRDARGKARPVAWVGGMVEPADGRLDIGFDERWVKRSGARAPFELRNLRIEDPDHFIPLIEADRIALELPAVRSKLAARDIVIDEAMTMGQRPVQLAAKSTGNRLLLVHGYCSGSVWPTSHFSNASTFLDANQSRSHDEFARLIRNFGSSWNSFGVVAHSQGGAAALHLYTYYWSGLDYASGNRLIQSVGTPYQGTNLAGILASMGSWFGVGCGSNDNLTYSGASAWLAGIPSWARAKVHYYTTSFATAWWRYDYCHMATDLVLSDPEDGTTERVNGQLSGAYNRGHTTGQCHTAGMRDPAQYHDANRNAVMNSNAAR